LKTVKVAIIGSGAIALANHLPGLALCPQAQLVALCDNNPTTLEQAAREVEVPHTFTDYNELLQKADTDAVIVTTPNFTHAPIALAAIRAGKHVLCEKPLALDAAQCVEMYRAAESANVRHMTAFTYRFVPGMRYMAHLVESGYIGQPYHFRANRFQDWGGRNLGWRQQFALAGSGELGDMLSHRLDYAHFLVGPLARLVAQTRQVYNERGGQPADVEDWVAVLADFRNGATGVWESSKLATGRGEGGNSLDLCEVNGSEGSLAYSLTSPNELLIGKPGGNGLEKVTVPPEFLVYPGSPRDPNVGNPVVTFRYDQDFEFIDAILNERPCRPSFAEGLRVQIIMDAILASARNKEWFDVDYGDVDFER
jgi:predicted dehydrogenase